MVFHLLFAVSLLILVVIVIWAIVSVDVSLWGLAISEYKAKKKKKCFVEPIMFTLFLVGWFLCCISQIFLEVV